MSTHSIYPIRYLFFLLITVVVALPLQATETGSSHNLFYLDKLSERSFFIARANLVTRDGFSDTFFGYADVNYRYMLSEPWSVEVGYRQAYLELGNQWREEYRPMLGLYWRGKLGKGQFSNRHRVEWRYFEGNAKNRKRYRNESVWRSKQTVTEFQLAPFIEDEVFYDLTDSKLTANWFTIGFSKRWSKKVKWKLGYRYQSQKFNEKWQHRHVLVTGISILLFD